MNNCIVSIFFVMFMSIAHSQDTLRVPDDFPLIQSALNSSQVGTTILVASGSYEESLIWPSGIDGIKLIGSGMDSTIISVMPDCEGLSTSEVNARSIYIEGDTLGDGTHIISTATLIQSLTLKGLLYSGDGAGIYIDHASPRLIEVSFKGSTNYGSGNGGGAYISDYNGSISNCDFSNCEIYGEAKGVGAYFRNFTGDLTNSKFLNNFSANDGEGIGAYFEGMHGTIVSCDFMENFSNTSTGKVQGVGIYLSNVSTDFTNCKFNNNLGERASGVGAIIKNCSGNFISCSFSNNRSTQSIGIGCFIVDSSCNFENCDFSNNKVPIGNAAGLYVERVNGDIVGCNFIDNESDGELWSNNSTASALSLRNFNGIINQCEFIGNKKDHAVSISNSETEMNNCVIYDNQSGSIDMSDSITDSIYINHCTIYNTARIFINNDYIEAKNSIFWNTIWTNDNPQEFLEVNGSNSAELIFEHCLVKNQPGVNLIDEDPDFRSDSLLIPESSSPCIGTGISSGLSEDILGNPRSLPTGTPPDIGAYEVDQSTSAADDTFSTFKIFPNPVDDQLSLSEEIDQLIIFDSQFNTLVISEYCRHLDTSQLNPGIYFLLIINNGKKEIRRFVVAR